MTGLEGVIAELRGAVEAAADPAGALGRLERFIARERAFGRSPAALSQDELAAARSTGARLGDVSASAAAIRASVARGAARIAAAEGMPVNFLSLPIPTEGK